MAREKKLNDKQLLFIEIYVSTLDAQRSYMEAYEVGIETAKTNAYKLLAKPEIKEIVDLRIQEKLESFTEDDILLELISIARDHDQKTGDRLRAIELLGKTRAMFVDKVKTEGSLDIVIDIEEEE